MWIILAIHYTYPARGKYFMFLVFLDYRFTLYIDEILYISRKRLKKRSVDTH